LVGIIRSIIFIYIWCVSRESHCFGFQLCRSWSKT